MSWLHSVRLTSESTTARTMGNDVSAGATADRSANTITFSGSSTQLSVLASPPGGPDETFRAAGTVNPTIVVPRDARVTVVS